MATVHQQNTGAAANVAHDRADPAWSEDTLRLVFESSPEAILLIDDGVFVDCNRAACEMLGYAGQPELLSLSPAELLPGNQTDGTFETPNAHEMIAIARTKGHHRFDSVARRANGSEFPVEVLLTAVPFKERKILHAVCRDISHRAEAQLELSRSRQALLSQTEILESILH